MNSNYIPYLKTKVSIGMQLCPQVMAFTARICMKLVTD